MCMNLIFDGDDTLWEDNVLFERAIEEFLDYLAHPTLPREQARHRLDDIERVTVKEHGYGVEGFELSLLKCLESLRDGTPCTDADRAAIRTMCHPIQSHTIELLEGVEETLQELSGRNRLFLLTKGEFSEQTAKVEASGLAGYFANVGILEEKEPTAYRNFVKQCSLATTQTWMIGNSPKSDIYPALEAGLGAVLVPHPMTWSLEDERISESHDRFLEVAPFSRLNAHF